MLGRTHSWGNMSHSWDEPEEYGCIYCGEHDVLYKWDGDGPMCWDCIEGAKEYIEAFEADDN